MKNRILNQILPAFVLLLAITGAFAFKSADTLAPLANQTAWADIPGNPCNISIECKTEPGADCTVEFEGEEYDAFGKVLPTSMTCTKVLHRISAR